MSATVEFTTLSKGNCDRTLEPFKDRNGSVVMPQRLMILTGKSKQELMSKIPGTYAYK